MFNVFKLSFVEFFCFLTSILPLSFVMLLFFCCCVFPLGDASDLFPGSCWLLLHLQLISMIGRLFKQPTPTIRHGSFVPVVGNWAVSDFVTLLFCFKFTVVFSLSPGLPRHPVKEHHLCLVSHTVHYGSFKLPFHLCKHCKYILHFQVSFPVCILGFRSVNHREQIQLG